MKAITTTRTTRHWPCWHRIAALYLLCFAATATTISASNMGNAVIVTRRGSAKGREPGGGVQFIQPASQRRFNRPWRRPEFQQSHRRDRNVASLHSHFLDFEEARRDARTRRWDVESLTSGKTKWSWTISIVNIAAFIVQAIVPGFEPWGIKRSDLILQGRELRRLLTPVFLHGNVGHLLTNVHCLCEVGPAVELFFGPGRFLATYLLAGVAGNALSALLSPIPSLGASGAIFGLLGAYTVFSSRHDWLPEHAEILNAPWSTAILNIFLGVITPSIDNWAHIGGFVGGAALGYYFGPRLYVTVRPSDGTRLLVDRPVLRLPRKVEQLPAQASVWTRQVLSKTSTQLDRFFGPLLPNSIGQGRRQLPWQRNQRRRQPPMENSTRSIKPDDDFLY